MPLTLLIQSLSKFSWLQSKQINPTVSVALPLLGSAFVKGLGLQMLAAALLAKKRASGGVRRVRRWWGGRLGRNSVEGTREGSWS